MHRLYEWFRTHRFLVDSAGAILLWLLLGLSSGVTSGLDHLLIASLLILPLALRRIRPVLAGSVIAIAAIAQWALGITPVPADAAVILTVYALAAYAPRWASLSGLGLALIGAVMAVSRYYFQPGGILSSLTFSKLSYAAVVLIMLCFLVLFVWTLGDLVRTRRLREQALEDRARRLEIEQLQERALAANDERAHIAREMHDIVAHSLSVIITQADGARYAAAQDPSLAPEALVTIAETGRSSLREMRRLLGVLRGGEEASTRPLPSLADLPELYLSFRSAGMDLEAPETTEGRGAHRTLPAGAELTAYRVVQEGLTNVLKHGGPKAHSTVQLSWQPRGLSIVIADDGRGAAADPPAPGGGNGLRGMSERVHLYDGMLEAGPRPGGGFQITALIPYTEA
ncbi:sensor histidine kinase [Psychromicrobium xiongbiense]|uniref:sensor histidine kinase n=1 Tax=Psychromicrobium xiongbiense TaxID=3051184 RepID=UPI00255590C3|nr:sensor histidine kinase [Psychromicrobium sp. YIM S02556]